MDAKYSNAIRDDQWESASKYLEIRSTRSDRQTVFQSWLAYPGPDQSIRFRDSAIEWLDGGPTLPVGDFGVGQISLTEDIRAESGAGDSEMRATDVALRFVRGILAYLRIVEALDDSMVIVESTD